MFFLRHLRKGGFPFGLARSYKKKILGKFSDEKKKKEIRNEKEQNSCKLIRIILKKTG